MFVLDKPKMALSAKKGAAAAQIVSYHIVYSVYDLNEETLGRTSVQGLLTDDFTSLVTLTSGDLVDKIFVEEVIFSSIGTATAVIDFGVLQADGVTRVLIFASKEIKPADALVFGNDGTVQTVLGDDITVTGGGGGGTNGGVTPPANPAAITILYKPETPTDINVNRTSAVDVQLTDEIADYETLFFVLRAGGPNTATAEFWSGILPVSVIPISTTNITGAGIHGRAWNGSSVVDEDIYCFRPEGDTDALKVHRANSGRNQLYAIYGL